MKILNKLLLSLKLFVSMHAGTFSNAGEYPMVQTEIIRIGVEFLSIGLTACSVYNLCRSVNSDKPDERKAIGKHAIMSIGGIVAIWFCYYLNPKSFLRISEDNLRFAKISSLDFAKD